MALDGSGAAYIVGETYYSNFPVRNAFQPRKSGSNLVNSSLGNAFVAKVLAEGDAIAYSSFLGGEICSLCQSVFGLPQYKADHGQGIAVDASGHAYITGMARSYTFPLLNSLIPNQGSDTVLQSSAFLSKVSMAGNSVMYTTLTATAMSDVFSVAVDTASNAYGAGTRTGGTDLISPGSFKTTPPSAIEGSALAYKLSSTSPTMALTSSTNPAVAQTPITLQATISDSTLTGSVIFLDGNSILGTAPISGGVATLSVAMLAGVHRLTAVYRTGTTTSDTAMLYQVVNPALMCQ